MLSAVDTYEAVMDVFTEHTGSTYRKQTSAMGALWAALDRVMSQRGILVKD